MTEVSQLLELAERVEKATGPDDALDAAIWLAVKADAASLKAYDEGLKLSRQEAAFRLSYMSDGFRPTASLDAALTLVPDGWRWVMRQASPDKANPNETGFFARLETDDFESVTWGKGSDWITDIVAGQDVFVWAATPALALTAACLKARASQDNRDD